VDCQNIRVEIIDRHGDLFESQRHWFGLNNTFSRVGRVFFAFPRDEKKLTIQVVTWKNPHTNLFEIINPCVTQPAAWTGEPLPQTRQVGGTEIVLAELQKRTNGGADPGKWKYWETPYIYWYPVWELRRNGEKLNGWETPEWTAEDPLGNKGQHLDVHQSVLRFFTTIYPKATNADEAQVIATLPQITLTNSQSIQWWNQKVSLQTNEILALGLFPPGSYGFSNGVFVTNAGGMRTVGGGAPTGWTSRRLAVTPLKMQTLYTHYSNTNYIIYLRVPETDSNYKLAMRLRDEQGRFWLAKLEPQGTPGGIFPFIMNLPPEVQTVTPELVVLKPIEAQFTVKVPEDSVQPEKIGSAADGRR
jgi:hypothetical protein